jgi:hypothetical protein
MALSNRERIARGMEQLRAGLGPFAEREFKARLGACWPEDLASRFDLKRGKDRAVECETAALVKAVGELWKEVFCHVLGQVERAYVGELRDVHSRWAREEPFTSDDTDRALDTMKRFLDAISAAVEAEEVQKLRVELQRTIYAEQARNKTRYQLTLEGMPKAGRGLRSRRRTRGPTVLLRP